MVDILPPQSVLTQNDAANELLAEGLDALGLTVPTLSPAWADATPNNAYSADAMTLALTRVRAPFRGMLTFEETPTFWSGVYGMPMSGPVAVLRLHPEAARRLERLAANRYGDPNMYPVPVAMVAQGVAPPATDIVVNWLLAGEILRWNLDGEPANFGDNRPVSFHDHRGLMIDPIAVAAIFADLMQAWPALRMTPPGAALAEDGDGGLEGIAALASGVRVQVIDPHGWAYTPTRPEARLKVIDANAAQVAEVPDGGLVNWTQAEHRLGRAANDDPEAPVDEDSPPPPPKPLHWGWATHGTLERTPLSLPALPDGVALSRRFLRVMAVDLNWHLLGNRTPSPVAGVPGDDNDIPDFALPHVRRAAPNFEYLVDAMAVLTTANGMAENFDADADDAFALLASPTIAPDLALPIGRWPNFPQPNGDDAMRTAAIDPTQGLTGRWRDSDDQQDSKDVILTIPRGDLPNGSHVRIFPRRFVEVRSIGEQPSFVRADGGSAIARADAATRILLVNPFNLAEDEPRPAPARLEVDIVLTSRSGQRRLFSVVAVAISGAENWDNNLSQFGGQSPLLDASPIADLMTAFSTQSIAPTPVFGIPGSRPTPADSDDPDNPILQLVRQLASESQPRQGPRFPTQARFETIFALGESNGAQLQWNALLSGARWDWESRSAQPELGNPGNPAGPDLHAAGIRCDGQLAYDLAFHALKRAQAIIPVAANSPGWLVTTAGDNWDAPDPDLSGTVSAAMLETIAPFCDSPELALPNISIPAPGQTIDNSLLDPLVAALGQDPDDFNFEVANEAEILPRLQREIATAKFGQRDALWALRRAIGQAREFIYIESPAFSPTAYPADPEAAPPPPSPPAYAIDLVEVIRQRLEENSRLKVMICLPRLPDFNVDRADWARAALSHRKTAIEQLILRARDRDRVAAFHPIGFPGRSAAIRSTVAIVDDVWCLVGTSHFRRRGMTFDGAVDVVSLDREIHNGYARGIAEFRRGLMAAKLGATAPAGPGDASSLWIRLTAPDSAFNAIADLLQQGGLGRCSPIWGGPTDNSGLERDPAIADPDGLNQVNLLELAQFALEN